MKRIFYGITIYLFLIVNANATNYIQNKNYTYDKVTEILSDEIIMLKRKIDSFDKSNKEYENKLTQLELKINNLESLSSNHLKSKKEVGVKDNFEQNRIRNNEETSNTILPTTIQEVIIDKELYEKVK
ncbi:hypothetical protein ACNSOL_12000 (plasmid) [Aliarcobacter lanthieri]|uniref:hypothetical protein n=1 Tax=Aliarcobacter lanthieri TaxID=1355374 RepID=UPI003AAE3FC9